MKNEKVKGIGGESIVAAAEAEIEQAKDELNFDVKLLAQYASPDNMAIPLDANVPDDTHCRWTREKNIDSRRRRGWEVIKYKADCEHGDGPVKMDDTILMGRPQKLQDAIMKEREKMNSTVQKIEDKVNQINQDITIGGLMPK